MDVESSSTEVHVILCDDFQSFAWHYYRFWKNLIRSSSYIFLCWVKGILPPSYTIFHRTFSVWSDRMTGRWRMNLHNELIYTSYIVWILPPLPLLLLCSQIDRIHYRLYIVRRHSITAQPEGIILIWSPYYPHRSPKRQSLAFFPFISLDESGQLTLQRYDSELIYPRDRNALFLVHLLFSLPLQSLTKTLFYS